MNVTKPLKDAEQFLEDMKMKEDARGAEDTDMTRARTIIAELISVGHYLQSGSAYT